MTCFRPRTAWQSEEYGGRPVFRRPRVDAGWNEIKLPCRRCVGCQNDYGRDAVVRCSNEALMHGCDNCFVTLTYDDEHLPYRGDLVQSDFTLWMKRLRFDILPETVRYYGCAEYGPLNSRPHFHTNLFGWRFDDAKPWKKCGSGEIVNVSERLSKTWQFGFIGVQEFSPATAGYCAGYVTKKRYGAKAEDHYRRFDELGEYQLTPEFPLMSRMPGVGVPWLEKYFDDVYPHDYVIVQGRKYKPPKAYDRLASEWYPQMFEQVQARRVEQLEDHAADFTWERLQVRETCARDRLKNKRRDGV